MIRLTTYLGVAAACLLSAGGARAALVFTGIDANPSNLPQVANTNSGAAETSFKSNLLGVGTENFETKTVGSSSPLAVNFGAAGTATLNGGGTVRQNPVGGNSGGRYSVPGGTRYLETNANAAGSFNVTFTNNIAAFGFYGSDLGDFGGTLQLQFVNSLNQVVGLRSVAEAPVASANASLVYFGYIADVGSEFNRVNFLLNDVDAGTQDVFGFDSFTIGTREQVSVVPEPNALALAGTALAGLVLTRRRRQGATIRS